MSSSLKIMQNKTNSTGLKSIYNSYFHKNQALLLESLHKLVKKSNSENNFVANVMFLEDIQQQSGKNNSKFIAEMKQSIKKYKLTGFIIHIDKHRSRSAHAIAGIITKHDNGSHTMELYDSNAMNPDNKIKVGVQTFHKYYLQTIIQINSHVVRLKANTTMFLNINNVPRLLCIKEGMCSIWAIMYILNRLFNVSIINTKTQIKRISNSSNQFEFTQQFLSLMQLFVNNGENNKTKKIAFNAFIQLITNS